MSAPYATIQDVRDRGVSFEAATNAQVFTALERATRMIDSYAGRDFRARDRIVRLDGSGAETLFLDDRPVVKVKDVLVDGLRLDPRDYVLYAEEGYIKLDGGARSIFAGFPAAFPKGNQNVEVRALFGFLAVPPEVKEACILLAIEFLRTGPAEADVAAGSSASTRNAIGISHFLKNEMGIDVVMCSVSSAQAAERVREVCDTVLIAPTIDEKRDLFVAKSPMVIFGNFYDKKVSMDEGFTNFIFADIPTIGYLNSENCPFMGFMGAKYLVQAIVNEVYMKIFLETKGELAGPIAYGDVPWDTDAKEAFLKISEMIPHFVRATAMKKLQQVAEQLAQERKSPITRAIMQEVADKYTPTKFKAKFSSVFGEPLAESADTADDAPIDQLPYRMEWEESARQTLAEVPAPFRAAAVSGTEEYARNHGYQTITVQVIEEFRKELGM